MPYDRRLFTTLALSTTAATVVLPSALLAAPRRSSDLVIGTLQWSEDQGATWHAGPVRDGSELLFQAVVRNAGSAAVPNKMVRVDFRIDDNLVASIVQLAALGAGDELTLTGAEPWLAEAGHYRLRARVDPDDLVPSEQSEGNNQIVANLDVLVAADMLVAGDGIQCPLSAEQLEIGKRGKGLSELATWKADEHRRMVGRMMKENGIPAAEAAEIAKRVLENRLDTATADALAAVAVGSTGAAMRDRRALFSTLIAAGAVAAPLSTADALTITQTLVNLGVAVAKIAAIGVGVLASGGSMLGFAAVAVDQALGFNLFPSGEITPNTFVGYSSGTGGPVIGNSRLPTTVANISNANFAGTTSAKAAFAGKTWGWLARWFGNFTNIRVYGSGGMIQSYRTNSNRLRSQFYMYDGTAPTRDTAALSMWISGFTDSNGVPRAAGGHSVPTQHGCLGGRFYAFSMGPAMRLGVVTAQPLLDHIYRACRDLGFRNYQLQYNGVVLGVLNHVSSLGMPTALQATPFNGDRSANYGGSGLLTIVDYARQVGTVVPGITPYMVYEAIAKRGKADFRLAAPPLAMIIKKTYEFFRRNGWDLNKMADEMAAYMTSRGRTEFTLAGLADVIFDILNGADMIHPEMRRNLVQQHILAMERGVVPLGGPTRPKVTITNEVKATLGVAPFEQNIPPSVTEYVLMNSIYSQWCRGVLGSGKVLRLVGGVIKVT